MNAALAARNRHLNAAPSAIEIARELGADIRQACERSRRRGQIRRRQLRAAQNVGPGRSRRAARARRRRRRHRRAGRHAAHAGLSLRLDRRSPSRCTRTRWPFRPGAGSTRRPGRRRTAAEAHRQRAHPCCCRAAVRTGSRGSGKAEKVEGGYRITARKIFTSGAPTGDLLMTGAVLEKRGRAADGAAFRHADEFAAREGARHLAHARHARHRLARRR